MRKHIRLFFIVIQFFICIIFILSSILFCISTWIQENLDVTLSQIVATITGDIQGFDISTALQINTLLKPIILFLLALLLLFLLLVLERMVKVSVAKKKTSRREFLCLRVVYSCLLIILSIECVILSSKKLCFGTPLSNHDKTTNVYEVYYSIPDSSLLSNNGDTNNLIMIYLESMETALTSDNFGGLSDSTNYIPNLTQLAKDNISFSSGSLVGGLQVTHQADNTKGSLVATSFGSPIYKDWKTLIEYYPIGKAIGDILCENGYKNYFLCGSDSNFSNTKSFLKNHGNYTIFDYYTAISEGYIDENYKVFWGYEDELLYEIAKDKLTDISKNKNKFNFTMQTIDTHFPNGYICNLCEDQYNSQYMNVYSCADKQIHNFIDWCIEQPWFTNTTIVIMGDHPTMNKTSFSIVPSSERTVYNCIINSKAQSKSIEKERIATTMDMYPTTLAALGFEIQGNRLGLGTNLFAKEKTIPEIIGYQDFNNEMEMKSDYCLTYFTSES